MTTPLEKTQKKFASLVTDGNNDARMRVYTRAYRARLAEALEDDFVVTKKLAGEKNFESWVSLYVDQHPSTSPTLSAFGQNFADLIHTRVAPSEGWLVDLARVEWALALTVFGPPAATDDLFCPLTTLSQKELEDLQLIPHPSLVLLRSAWPIDAIYEKERAPAKKEAVTIAVYLNPEDKACYRRCTPQEALLARAILEKKKLTEAAIALTSAGADAALVRNVFTVARRCGWVIGLTGPRFH